MLHLNTGSQNYLNMEKKCSESATGSESLHPEMTHIITLAQIHWSKYITWPTMPDIKGKEGKDSPTNGPRKRRAESI